MSRLLSTPMGLFFPLLSVRQPSPVFSMSYQDHGTGVPSLCELTWQRAEAAPFSPAEAQSSNAPVQSDPADRSGALGPLALTVRSESRIHPQYRTGVTFISGLLVDGSVCLVSPQRERLVCMMFQKQMMKTIFI